MVDRHHMFAESRRLITEAAARPLPVASGMGSWFDYCEAVAPRYATLWKRLRAMDYEEDVSNLTRGWLTPLLATEPPSEAINGLWFGLRNPILADGAATCALYLGGSSGFVAESESNEWVCDLSYRPKGRYAPSRILIELYRSVEALDEDNATCLGEPFLCHGYTALLVSQWCHGPMRSALLGGCRIRAVVMGHDNGDFYRIAVLRADSAA